MATFGGTTFGERGGGGGRDFPVHGASGTYATYVIPGGAAQLVRVGDAITDLTVPASGTAAVLSSLRGKEGDAGTLSYAGGSLSCTLKAVSNARQVLNGYDLYFFDLVFSHA